MQEKLNSQGLSDNMPNKPKLDNDFERYLHEIISSYRSIDKINLANLHEKLEVSKNTFKRLRKEPQSASVYEIQKLAEILNIPPVTLFDRIIESSKKK